MAPRYGFNSAEVITSRRVPEEAFHALKRWNRSQKLPELTDEQLVLVLLSCYNFLEASQKTILAYFKCKSSAPELFFNRDFNAEDVQKAMKVCNCIALPTKTNKNEAIIYWKLSDTSASHFHIEQIIKLIFMVGELTFYQDTPDGVIVVIDMKGLGLFHITRLRVAPLRKFFWFVQDGYFCKIKEIHVLNTSYFIDKIMFILRPLMNKELYNIIQFHPSSLPMEEFFIKHVPKHCMPQDYGGDLETTQVLTLKTYNSIKGMKLFYKQEEEQIKEYLNLQ